MEMKFGTKITTGLASALVAAGMFAAPAAAETKTIEMPAGLCSYQPITKDLVAQIQGRADFDKVLSYLGENCPEVAVMFADEPTATIASGLTMGGTAAAPAEEGVDPGPSNVDRSDGPLGDGTADRDNGTGNDNKQPK